MRKRRGILPLLRWQSRFDCGAQWDLLSDGGLAGQVRDAHASEVAADGLHQGEVGGAAQSWREHGECGWRGVDVSRRAEDGGVRGWSDVLRRVVGCLFNTQDRVH